jgi:hypothetical protein
LRTAILVGIVGLIAAVAVAGMKSRALE